MSTPRKKHVGITEGTQHNVLKNLLISAGILFGYENKLEHERELE